MKHFQEILKTLGAANTALINSSPDWDFWCAEYVTPVSTVRGYYLYLKHKCPLKEASRVNLLYWRDNSGTYGYEVIVTPKSDLAQKLVQVKDTFKGKSARTSRQLLTDNFLKDMKTRPVSFEDYFVEPAIELEDGTTEQKGTDFLRGWLTGLNPGNKARSIAVLVADGGIGKTTVSRYLCQKIDKSGTVIPIVIESDQWKHLIQSNITMNVLWDLAVSRRFDQANRLLSNEVALRALIQAGVFVVVFDGFDELCGSSSCVYDAKDIIEKMTDIATAEDDFVNARILLTSRKTYWDSVSDEVDTKDIEVFRLKGFDNEQKKEYFEGRLPDPKERDIANRLAKEICGAIYDNMEIEDQNEDRPSGVPFILDLIAQYVHRNPDVNINPYRGDHLERLITDVCRRENNRQELHIDPEQQIVLFEELFREYPASFTFDDLKLYLEYLCNVTEPSVFQKFTAHPLLNRTAEDHFGPKYEVLRVYFIARFLAHGLTSLYMKTDRTKISRILAANSTGKTQVIDWLVRQLKQMDGVKRQNAFKHAVDIIQDPEHRETFRASAAAIFHIAKHFIEGNDRADRLQSLAMLLCGVNRDGQITFRRMVFTGHIRSFDFTHTDFNDCVIIDAEFKNCKFSEHTKFHGCFFDGSLLFDRCEDASSASISANCSFSKEAEFMLNTLKQTAPRNDLKKAFAEDALMRALKKFKSPFGFTSIQFSHKNSGFKHGNPYNEDIWKALLNNNIIERHEISNVADGGLNLIDEKEIRREITTYLDNAVVGARLLLVIEELMK